MLRYNQMKKPTTMQYNSTSGQNPAANPLNLNYSSKNKVKQQSDAQLSEWLKCRNNPLYFILNYCYIEETGGRIRYTSDKLHPKLRRVVRATVKYHSAIFMASRQLGKSTIAACILAWASIFYPKTYSIVLNFQKKVGYGNLNKIRFINDSLPSWMRVPYASKSERKTYIQFKNGSMIDIFYPSTISRPETLARSLTAPILYMDEAAFINYMDKIYGSAQQTLATARQQAKKNNYPYFTLITSTPNGTIGSGEWFYKRWMNALDSDKVFQMNEDSGIEDWIEDDITPMLDNPDICNGFIKVKYHWSEDPNKDEQWYKKQCQELDDKRLINQELDLMFVGTQYCIFDDDLLTEMKPHNKPVDTLQLPYQIVPNMSFDLFKKAEEIDKTDYYLVGVDTASSMKGAYNSIEVFSFRYFNQIAEFNYKIGSLNKYAKVVDFFFRWLRSIVGDRILICFENNSVGKAPIEDLLENVHDINYREYIYTDTRTHPSLSFKKKNNSASNQPQHDTKYPGITTSSANKDFMIGCFIEALNENPQAIKSKKLYDQLSSIERTQAGTIRSKYFTDMFMACCLCAMVRKKKSIEILPLIGMDNEKVQQNAYNLYRNVAEMNNPKRQSTSQHQTGMDYDISQFQNPFREPAPLCGDDPIANQYDSNNDPSYSEDLMKEQIKIISDIF